MPTNWIDFQAQSCELTSWQPDFFGRPVSKYGPSSSILPPPFTFSIYFIFRRNRFQSKCKGFSSRRQNFQFLFDWVSKSYAELYFWARSALLKEHVSQFGQKSESLFSTLFFPPSACSQSHTRALVTTPFCSLASQFWDKEAQFVSLKLPPLLGPPTSPTSQFLFSSDFFIHRRAWIFGGEIVERFPSGAVSHFSEKYFPLTQWVRKMDPEIALEMFW